MRSLSWTGDYSVDMRPITKITIFGLRLATCVLAIYWIVLFLGTHVPTLPTLAKSFSDKALHFSGYFGLAMLMCWVWPSDRGVARKFVSIGLLVITYAAFDEISQGFVRGRSTDLEDFFADALGTLCAIGCYALARWLYLEWTLRRSSVAVD